MTVELKMPALSPTMEKGTLAKWLVGVGDVVKAGDMLAEIETDKATMEFEAVDEGRIARLLVGPGTENVAVGTVIAVMAEEGEAVAEPTEVPASPPAPTTASVSTPDPIAAVTAQAAAALPAPPVAIDAAANATPLARRIAAARAIPLSSMRGSGPNGRIVKADLVAPPSAAASSASAPASPAAAPSPIAPAGSAPPPEGVPAQAIPLSGMRKTIARRLTEAKQTVPHFYLTVRCRLDALLKLREDLNASLAARGEKLSVNDMLIKAMALAMARVPEANVQFGGDVLHRFDRVDIAMAVAIDGGLVTPVIKDVGALSLTAIASASKSLAQKARDGKLLLEAYQGGTASISNLGMFGIDEMVPVINPPQALIVGIGAGVEPPWKVDGAVGLATIMAATGSFDHRAIDGAVAARFMAAFREIVETPMLILA